MTTDCNCRNCLSDKVCQSSGLPLALVTFIACPECGNKRCPKATWHVNPCTDSNASGQKGSDYK